MTGTSTPLMVPKELSGWENIEMVQKYAHLAPSHLAIHAGNNVKFLANVVAGNENQADSIALTA